MENTATTENRLRKHKLYVRKRGNERQKVFWVQQNVSETVYKLFSNFEICSPNLATVPNK